MTKKKDGEVIDLKVSKDDGVARPEGELKTTDEQLPAIIPDEGVVDLDVKTAESRLKGIANFQYLVQKSLIEGLDYGVIPGTKQKTLLKAGAEKICKLMGLSDHHYILHKIERWEKDDPFFHYICKTQLKSIKTGQIMSEGLGECNSMDPKYRFRWCWKSYLPPDQLANIENLPMRKALAEDGNWYPKYRIEDKEVIFGLVNTILKMAKKKSMVDGVKSVGRISGLFTQDLEDLEHLHTETKPGEEVKKPAAKASTRKPPPPRATKKKDAQPPRSRPGQAPAAGSDEEQLAFLSAAFKAAILEIRPDNYKEAFNSFKRWAAEVQKEKGKTWVLANDGGRLTFTLGIHADVKLLWKHKEWALQKWEEWDQEHNQEPKEPNWDEG